MINYSIVMRAVNSNLLEINAAKSRIAKAKKDGLEPDENDVKLAESELVTRAYGVAQYSGVMDIDKFAKHISTHGCVYSRADISAILYMAVDCMREQLLEGKKIRLGDLGDFSVMLSSKGADSAEKFTAQNFTSVNVVWDCGAEFKNLLEDAEFNLVASRSAQAKVLKAIKAGESIVDLNDPADPSDPSDPSDSTTPTPTPKAKYTITAVSANESQGSVTGGGTYDEGTEVTLKATAKSGYTFSKWSDGVATSTRKVTVSGDATFTAEFVEQSNTPPSI